MALPIETVWRVTRRLAADFRPGLFDQLSMAGDLGVGWYPSRPQVASQLRQLGIRVDSQRLPEQTGLLFPFHAANGKLSHLTVLPIDQDGNLDPDRQTIIHRGRRYQTTDPVGIFGSRYLQRERTYSKLTLCEDPGMACRYARAFALSRPNESLIRAIRQATPVVELRGRDAFFQAMLPLTHYGLRLEIHGQWHVDYWVDKIIRLAHESGDTTVAACGLADLLPGMVEHDRLEVVTRLQERTHVDFSRLMPAERPATEREEESYKRAFALAVTPLVRQLRVNPRLNQVYAPQLGWGMLTREFAAMILVRNAPLPCADPIEFVQKVVKVPLPTAYGFREGAHLPPYDVGLRIASDVLQLIIKEAPVELA